MEALQEVMDALESLFFSVMPCLFPMFLLYLWLYPGPALLFSAFTCLFVTLPCPGCSLFAVCYKYSGPCTSVCPPWHFPVFTLLFSTDYLVCITWWFVHHHAVFCFALYPLCLFFKWSSSCAPTSTTSPPYYCKVTQTWVTSSVEEPGCLSEHPNKIRFARTVFILIMQAMIEWVKDWVL